MVFLTKSTGKDFLFFFGGALLHPTVINAKKLAMMTKYLDK
jgi:hypothetical protein